MFESKDSLNFKKRKIKRSFDLEPQEILLDRLAQKKALDLGISEGRFEVPLSGEIIQLTYILFVFIVLLLFNRVFQLQVVQGKDYSARAENNKFIVYQIKATRGVIYDKNMKQLVFNQPSFDLVCFDDNLPKDDVEKKDIIIEVANVLEQDYEEIKKNIEDGDYQITIKKNLSHQELIILETKIKDLYGFSINHTSVRNYEDSNSFSHLMGYMGKIKSGELQELSKEYSFADWIGREGMEKFYENYLHEDRGQLQIERNALGDIISREIIDLPSPGNNLVLWINSDLQKKIREELLIVKSKRGFEKAAAVVINPNSGGVLALVSFPDFDNNLFQKNSETEKLEDLLSGKEGSLFNRAIGGSYPPGSIIKPLLATAILEEELISPEQNIYDGGILEIPHQYDSEITYNFTGTPHGYVDLRKALAVSSNVYFYILGGGYKNQEGLGPTRIKQYLELFGWGAPTNIDLFGEVSGLVPDPEWKERVKNEKWWDGDTYNSSIGQGNILVTPLQVANAFVAIANDGTLFEPRIVQKIINEKGELVKEIESKVIRKDFVDKENLKIVKEGMRQGVVLPEGTGHLLNTLPVEVASKTGTAETSKNDYYHKWVVVMAPYENPEIVLLIMMENVKGTETAVVPVANNVLEWYFGNHE
ncbi:MAG: penicillin-binding protein 2 [Patescibacteria group bacterium]